VNREQGCIQSASKLGMSTSRHRNHCGAIKEVLAHIKIEID